MTISWRSLVASIAILNILAGAARAAPDFGPNCTSCHNQRSDGALNFVPSNLLSIPAGGMGQITFNVTDIGNSGDAAIGLRGLDAAALMATPDLTIWNNQTDGTVNWLTSNPFSDVPISLVLKLTIAAGATPADYPINLALAGRDTQRWGTTQNFTVRVLMAGVPGDYNGNGKVDAADYVVWRNGGPLQNEVDTPGIVNAADYTAWRARFGNTSGAGSVTFAIVPVSIPEPATVLLAVLGLLASYVFPRRRH